MVGEQVPLGYIRSVGSRSVPAVRPEPLEVSPPLEVLLLEVRQYGVDHAARYGEWPDPVVLVGQGLWSEIVRGFQLSPLTAMLTRPDPDGGALLMAAPGGKQAKVFPTSFVGAREWKILTGGPGGTL